MNECDWRRFGLPAFTYSNPTMGTAKQYAKSGAFYQNLTSVAFIVSLKQISHIVLVFPLLTLSK